MVNKLLISIVAVLFGIMSFGSITANTGEYTPVPVDESTRVAYVDAIYRADGDCYIDADFIEWYEGEAANRIFREREADSGMDEAPDGYYIVNDDQAIERLKRSERTSPARLRILRCDDIVLCGTARRRATSPAGSPSGSAATSRRKTSIRVP